MFGRSIALTLAAALGVALAPSASEAQGWNAKFGGLPGRDYIQAELGYSNVPKVAYMFGISNNLSIGPAFAFDLGYYQTRGTQPGLGFSAPIRFGLLRSGNKSLGLTFEPGLALSFPQFGDTGIALLLNVGGNFGVEVAPNVTIGGGVDLPIALGLSPGFAFIMPILFGPVIEYRAIDDLSILFDMKLGPHVTFGDGGSAVVFGLKLAAGIAYRF
jgi:hypothetical protein